MTTDIAVWMAFFLWSAYWLAVAVSAALTEWAKAMTEAKRRSYVVPAWKSMAVLAVTVAFSVAAFAIPWSILPGAYWLATWMAGGTRF